MSTRLPLPSGDQAATDLVAVDAGQVAVEHDHVVGVDPGALERGPAIEGDVDGQGLTTEHVRDRLGELLMVFDEAATPSRLLLGHLRVVARRALDAATSAMDRQDGTDPGNSPCNLWRSPSCSDRAVP